MLHSSFDLETHARMVQADALRDADRARLLAAARNGQVRGNRSNAVGLLLTAIRERLTRRRLAPADIAAPVADDVVVPDFSMIVVAEDPHPVPGRRPARAAEPYAAMVVIARSANVPVSGQPREVMGS